MAIEALFQQARVIGLLPDSVEIHEATYQLRNVIFTHPLIIEDDGKDYKITLSLTGSSESKQTWRKFQISSSREDMTTNHCHGQIRIIEVPSISKLITPSCIVCMEVDILMVLKLEQKRNYSRCNTLCQQWPGMKQHTV